MRKILTVAVVLLILAGSTGCNPFKRYVHIHDRYPVYPLPVEAQIAKISTEELAPLSPEARGKVIDTVKELKTEKAALRTFLESYNKYAETKNAEYDQLFRKK